MGPGPRVRDWAVGFDGGEEAHYRRRWRAPHAAVRLLRTRRPTPKKHDSWAQASVPEAGPLLVSAEVKRRTTAGGGVLLTRQTGPLLSVEVKRRTTVGGSVLFTRQFAFSAHRTWRARCMTCGPGPPCQRLDRWLRRRRGGTIP